MSSDVDTDVVKAAIVAYCINQCGGEVRIPRRYLHELANGVGQIFITGDPVRGEYIVRTEQVVKGEETQDQTQQFEEEYGSVVDERLFDDDLLENEKEL